MKSKSFTYILIFFLLVQTASAVSSNLKNEYQKKETIIIEIYGNILQPINLEQVTLKKGTQPVGFDGEIRKLGGRNFLWIIAPQTMAEYTLIIEDIIEDSGNGPEIVDYMQKFNVSLNTTDYSIKPGFIFTEDNFEIDVTVYGSASTIISVDFPQQRNINLNPGENTVNFDISSVNGIRLIMINLGKYSAPAYIIGNNGPTCSNNILESDKGEKCECGVDGVCGNSDDNLNGKTCTTQEFDFGNLSCSADCLTFDTTQCVFENIETNENVTESNNTTNEMNETQNETANTAMLYFRFNPLIIESTILFSADIPSYFFEIFNYGNSTLNNMYLEYDKNKFSVSPTENISMGSNSSQRFELRVINVTGNPVRGAVIARVGEEYKFLLFSLTFTRNETEVKTQYLKNSSEEVASYYCSELSGKICTDARCSGEEISSIEGKCCLNQCVSENTGGNKSWIGYLIAAILVLFLGIIYLKYKKAGKTSGGEIMKSKIISAEKHFA